MKHRTIKRNSEREARKAQAREERALARGASQFPPDGYPVHMCTWRAGVKLTPARFRARYMGECAGCAFAAQ